MTLEQYIDDGLKKFTEQQQRSDTQIDNEALRLEREYISNKGSNANIQRAKKMFADNPDFIRQVEAMEQSPEAFAHSLKPYGLRTAEATFPRAMEAQKKGSKFPVVGATLDVMSYPFRYGEAAMAKADPTRGPVDIQQRMGQAQTGEFIADAIRDPMNVFMGAGTIGGSAAKAISPLTKLAGKFQPLAEEVASRGLSGAVDQVPYSLISQAERMERGESFSPAEFGTELAVGSFLPNAAKVVKEGGKFAKEFTKDFLSESTNRTREVLELVEAKPLKENLRTRFTTDKNPDEVLNKLRKFEEGAEGLAQEVVDKVDNLDVRYRENNNIVNKAISEMPDMDAGLLIDQLNNSKMLLPINPDPKAYKQELAFNAMIDSEVTKIQNRIANHNPFGTTQMMRGQKQGTLIPADEMLAIRRELDKNINYDLNTFNKGYKDPILKLRKNATGYIREELIKNAERTGNKEYAKAMKDFHRVLKMQDQAKKHLLPREEDLGVVDRSKNFLMRLGNPNKIDSRKWAKEFENITGMDLVSGGEWLKLSREYNGRLKMINDYRTGAKTFGVEALRDFPVAGKVLGAAASSPQAASHIYGGLNLGSDFMDWTEPGLSRLSKIATQQYIGE